MSTTFEIGRMPAAVSRARSQGGEGPILTSSNARHVARAALEVVDADVDALRPTRLRVEPGRRRELQVVERRDLAGEAVDAWRSGRLPVDSTQEQVRERQHIGERCARLGVGQEHDPGVVGAEVELLLGEDHPAETSPRSWPRRAEPGPGSLAPGKRDRHGGAHAEVPRAADDLARLGLADVHLAAEAGRHSGACPPRAPADAEEPVVAVLVDARAARSVDLGRADREPVASSSSGIGIGT